MGICEEKDRKYILRKQLGLTEDIRYTLGELVLSVKILKICLIVPPKKP